MLILLTGSEAIGKRYLAKAIVNKLNIFTYGGHTIEFKTKLDGNNEVVIDGIRSAEYIDEFSGDIDVVTWANEIYEQLCLKLLVYFYKFLIHPANVVGGYYRRMEYDLY